MIPLSKINDQYDIGEAFEAIENELISFHDPEFAPAQTGRD